MSVFTGPVHFSRDFLLCLLLYSGACSYMGRFHVPLDGIHTAVSHGGHHAVVIVAVGRPEQIGPDAGDGLDLAVAAVQLCLDLVGAQLGKIGVIVRVIHDFVSGIMEGLHRLGKLIHPFTHHEKGSLYLIFTKNVDKLLGVLVAPE